MGTGKFTFHRYHWSFISDLILSNGYQGNFYGGWIPKGGGCWHWFGTSSTQVSLRYLISDTMGLMEAVSWNLLAMFQNYARTFSGWLAAKHAGVIFPSFIFLCRFELWDLSDGIIPYPDSHFDLIHARSLNCGVSLTTCRFSRTMLTTSSR